MAAAAEDQSPAIGFVLSDLSLIQSLFDLAEQNKNPWSCGERCWNSQTGTGSGPETGSLGRLNPVQVQPEARGPLATLTFAPGGGSLYQLTSWVVSCPR